jgi:hypothetical protein
MLSPRCEHCGCALDAVVAEGPSASAPVRLFGPRWVLALRVAGVFLALLALYAATKAGYGAAGASGALIAFGMGGFLLVPFVPQRLGVPRG